MPRSPLLIAALLALPSIAAAELSPRSKVLAATVTVTGVAGFDGTIKENGKGTVNGDTQDIDQSVDMSTTYGFSAQADKPLHRNFSVGFIGRLVWWKSIQEQSDERVMSIEGLLAPRVRFPFSLGNDDWAIPYVQVSGGAGNNHVPDYSADSLPFAGNRTVYMGPSLLLGIETGAQFLLASHVGLAFSLGVSYREFGYKIAFNSYDGTIRANLNSTMAVTQLMGGAGVVFAF
jgi:hypothetical protein